MTSDFQIKRPQFRLKTGRINGIFNIKQRRKCFTPFCFNFPVTPFKGTVLIVDGYSEIGAHARSAIHFSIW